MKITFIGLSCFMIENSTGYRILVDPFEDSPEWALGPLFPTEFNGKPFGTNLLLVSETDADHARAPHEWQQNAPAVKPNSNPFPGLNLRGTIVYEWNGEPCIAWHYSVDGIRLAHFSDSSHLLMKDQLDELGHPDIIFYPIPKISWEYQESFDILRKNIAALQPKFVIWAHHITPKDMPSFEDRDMFRNFFMQYFKENASTNKGYQGEGSYMNLCDMVEGANHLTKEYKGEIINTPSIEVSNESLKKYTEPTAMFFTSMHATSKTDK